MVVRDWNEETREWLRLLEAACHRLHRAQQAMQQQEAVLSSVPLPRARTFVFAPGVSWPVVRDGDVYWGVAVVEVHGWENLTDLAPCLAKACRWQPRLILRAIRRMEAAAAWCEARAEGRRRAAQEIMRQQARAVEALEAEAAMHALAR